MKKNLFKLMLLATVSLFALTACGGSGTGGDNKDSGSARYRSIQQIKDSGKLTIGVFSDKKPFGYVDENGAYQGYDIELGNRLAQDMGVEVDYMPVEAANRVEYLETAKVDIILANFTVTKERAEKVDFALPYMKVALGIVSPENALITAPEQLNGKTLIISKGTTAEKYFMEEYPDVKQLKFDQYSEAFNALLDGRADALSTDNTEVLAWAIENPGFKVGVESLGNNDTIAPAVSKGNKELLDWINDDIKKLGEENFFHKAYQKTLEPVYGNQVDPNTIVVEGGKID